MWTFLSPWLTQNGGQGQRNRPGRPGNCQTNIFIYKDDIDVSELSTQLEIFVTSFSEPKATIHELIKCLQTLSADTL